MELGLFLRAFQDQPLEAGLDRARTQGFSAVEIAVHAGNGHLDLEALRNPDERRRLRSLVHRKELRLVALSIHRESQLVLGPHGASTQRFCSGTETEQIAYGTDRVKLAAEIASDLEVPVVVGYSGCPAFDRWFPWPDPAWARMEELFQERWLPILDVFQGHGVRFAHEVNIQQMAYNLETAQRALDLVGHHPAWGYTLDPANLVLVGVRPDAFAAELGSRIYHVHAKDAELVPHLADRSGWMVHGDWSRPGRGFRYRIPGWGQVPWRALLSELQAANYHGPICLEYEDPLVDAEEGLHKSVEFLKPLLFSRPKPQRGN